MAGELSDEDVERIAKATAKLMGKTATGNGGEQPSSGSSGKKRMPPSMKNLLGSLVRKGPDE